jgi:ferric-dicitrate binding protein FerR (iron transport regulator)
MGDVTNPPPQDPLWDTAWAWVQHQHENPDLDEPSRAELARWLAADSRHVAVYEKACRLWLVAGMVPPANDIESPEG